MTFWKVGEPIKRSSESRELAEIDWPMVLGPVLASAAEPPSTAVRSEEIDALQEATFGYVRRAVRPRPGMPLAELPFLSEAVPWYQQGRFVVEPTQVAPIRPGAWVHYAAGDYYIQDAGSMLALALCAARPGEWVCDTCAAPGGKATGLLEQLGGSGVLVANEVIRSRLSLLTVALERCGYGNQLVTNLEIEQLAQLCGAAFDCVLVDAPCTGQTMVARGKQSMAAFGAAQIAHSSARQQRILRAAADLVKPGGRLVYSTCAYSYDENEALVRDFIDSRPEWQLTSREGLEAWESPLDEGCYRVWPHRHGCSGAFAALLVKRSADIASTSLETMAANNIPATRLRAKLAWQTIASLPAELEALLGDEAGSWWLSGDRLHHFSRLFPNDWIAMAVAGTELARRASESRKERWTPSYGAAILHDATGERADKIVSVGDRPLAAENLIELDDAEVIRYVSGESLRCTSQRSLAGCTVWHEDGWRRVAWRGRQLGWCKLTKGILKNHFPKVLRQSGAVCG